MTATEPTQTHLRRPIVRVVLHVIRRLGAFKLALLLTRRCVRILAYHGIALGDLHIYAPFLFMQESTFRRRLEIVRKRRMNVISLDEAVTSLQTGSSQGNEVVITIDDGWWRTPSSLPRPLLNRFLAIRRRCIFLPDTPSTGPRWPPSCSATCSGSAVRPN